MAVEAVTCEPVSVKAFPCYAGKYRELLLIWLRNTELGSLFTPYIIRSPRNSLRIGTGNFLRDNSEFSRRIRERGSAAFDAGG